MRMRHLKNVLTIINAESEMNIVLAEAKNILNDVVTWNPVAMAA
jgi:hypothetical protein